MSTTDNKRIWVLGASDPEMSAIERLLTSVRENVTYATVTGTNKRVHPGNAYRADVPHALTEVLCFGCWGTGILDDSVCSGCEGTGNVYRGAREVYLVECGFESTTSMSVLCDLVKIDHHRPGDHGYGAPPQEFFTASSIGQVFGHLAGLGIVPRDARTQELLLTAAADHCLESAYRGLCPGIDPDALGLWRAHSRSQFQGRPFESVLADVEAARVILRGSASGREYADLRGQSIPELPEAAAREGIPFLGTVSDRDGRVKVVLQAAPAHLITRFLAGEIVPGLVDFYGDSARGFAGGYLPVTS